MNTPTWHTEHAKTVLDEWHDRYKMFMDYQRDYYSESSELLQGIVLHTN